MTDLEIRDVFDAFGRTLREYSPDGEDFAGTEYGLLRNEIYEKSDLLSGEYFGSTSTQFFDGLGRLVRVIDRLNLTESGQDLLATDYGYDTLGDVIRMESGRLSGDELSGFEGHSVVKTSVYDSNGIEVFQDDPDRLEMYFVYNELGDLIRWQDGRGITNSYAYDLGGRLTAEDYGNDFLADVIYGYDEAFSAEWYTTETTCHRFDPLADCPSGQQNLLGRLSYVEDRSGTRIWSYDVRGQARWVNMQMSSYERDAYEEWIKRDDLSQIWHTETQYDEMGRTLWQDFPEEGSRVFYLYSERGLVDSLVLDRETWMDPQPVIQKVYYDALGKQTRVEYGDTSQTTVEYSYDDRQRLTDLLAHQENFDPGEGPPEDRTLLDYEYQFDEASNIWKIIDHRDYELISDWSPVPADYEYAYDSLNRLKTASPSYHESQPDRIGVQEWAFDKLGSMKSWTDPAHGFYGWSLANIRNGLQLIEDEELTIVDDRPPAPHALYKAYDEVSGEGSYLVAHYDFGGYMTSLEVYKGCGECNPVDYTCELPCDSAELTELFWDEVGRLIEAKKRPGTCDEVECTFSETPTTHYQHTYDSSNVRTVKKDVLEEEYDLYLSGSFEIRGATLSVGDEFEGGESTKYATLFGNRVARLVEESTWLPENESYYFIYLSNHLGSTSIVVDSDTGDVIEARMDLPYGATDASMLNPDPAYGPFTADYTFTGKEEDADIDLFYFGERYLSSLLGRWVSPDPLISKTAGGINAYAYVRNNPIKMVDPLGLEEEQASEQQENESVVTKVGKLALGGMLGIYETVVPVSEIKETVGLEEGGYYKDQDVEAGAMVGRVIGSVLEIGLGFYSIQKGIQTIEAGVGTGGVIAIGAPGPTKAAAIVVGGALVAEGSALMAGGAMLMSKGGNDLDKSLKAFNDKKGKEYKQAEAENQKAKNMQQTQNAGTQSSTSTWKKLTNKEARNLAKEMGYKETNVSFDSQGQLVFKKGNTYISPDATGHKGGTWKVFDKNGNRLGTFNSDLTKRVGD